ncbi:MAG: class I SAM-dependent methyltransferase [bacterium]|nr:class I SAM-dependent methyltransferase [bacterium]
MVDLTSRAGIHTRRMDALEALRSTPPASLGGLFAAQVVEHFFPGELLEFLVLARRRLAPGGRIVLETLNPASLGVMAKSYWRDLDHKQAIHPDALRMLVELAGFAAVETRYLAPFGDDERLPELPPAAEGGLSPEARAVLQDRFDRINAALYGMQDYYVTGLQATPLGDGAGERLAPVDPAAAGGCGS